MELLPLPDGRPGQHLGISHTLKHYLDPSEVWEDLAPDDLMYRPWSVLDGLAHVEPAVWKQWPAPGPVVSGLWSSELKSIYRHGYFATLLALTRDLSPPGDRLWTRSARGHEVYLRLTPEGVILIVGKEAAGAGLRTAFRPLGFPRKTHVDVAMDPASRERRANLARLKAFKVHRLTVWRRP